MKRTTVALTALLVMSAPGAARADKLPTDQGLPVTLSPVISKIKVNQVVDFKVKWTDDDAASAETDLFVQSIGGSGISGDGGCASPLDRRPNRGGAVVTAKFTKPGKYLVRGTVTTSPCHKRLTGLGDERVVVSRAVTVIA